MRYLIVSGEGKSIGLARKLEKEGHAVNVHIVEPTCQRKGTGIISTLKTPRPILDSEGVYNLSAVEFLMNAARPDITIFDSPATHTMAARMQKSGHRVIGPVEAPLRNTLLPMATEQRLEGWFNGQRFLQPIALHLVSRALMPGNIGALTEGTGCISMFLAETSPLVTKLRTLEPTLRASAYRGPVTALMLDDQIVDVLMQPMDTTNALYETLFGSIGQFLVNVANGSDVDHRALSPYVVGVRVWLPAWPYRGQDCAPEFIDGLNDGNMKHLWPNDLTYSNGQFRTTSQSNDIGWVTARGESLREAVRRAYRTIENISAPMLSYRNDIGEAWEHIRDFVNAATHKAGVCPVT